MSIRVATAVMLTGVMLSHVTTTAQAQPAQARSSP
jgi:hypothetical protein